MRWTYLAAALVLGAAFGLSAATADAQPRAKRVVVDARGHTVYVSRDENGRRRTRIIIQKRSYLDPGTEPLPSDRNQLDYVSRPDQRPIDVLDNTAFGGNQTALPGPWTLPFKRNPYLTGGYSQ